MSNKRITSWERRRRRRVKVTVFTSVLFFLVIAAGITFKLMLPYETWNLSEFYTVSFEGYNTEGSVSLVLDEAALDAAMATLRADYKDSLIHIHDCSDSDYDSFKQSINASVITQGHLMNGSKVLIAFSCDNELAHKLRVNITGTSLQTTVTGLVNAVKLSADDIFANLNVTFRGISPNVTMSLTNTSSDPFLSQIVFNPVEIKEHYSVGEAVTVRAFYNQDEALKYHYSIDEDSQNCLREYTVTSDSAYISDPSELPASVVEEAVSAGLSAFNDANEYGVRIFCEANLVPVYINKQATFEWVKPSFRSAYLKCVRSEYAGSLGHHYNDLDIIYSVSITQANGVTCPCYAVVRFSDIIVNSDGSITYDFSAPKIMSSDYDIDSIHKTVATSFESTHTVTKIKSN